MSAYMAADDPRHGTVAGYNAHRRANFPICDACRRAKMRYEKARQLAGGVLKVPAVGTQRRIRALRALGYSLGDITRGGGWCDHTALDYALGADTITAATADRVAATYERLSMRLADGPKANRLRMLAARKGWPPPLAWDNLDDPDEQPHGWQYVASDRHADRHAELDDLLDRGAWLSEACRVLRVTSESLEKWCERQGRRQDYIRLRDRERGAA